MKAKTIKSILFITLIILCGCKNPASSGSGISNGILGDSEGNPIIINSIDELAAINTALEKHYKLGGNLDLTGEAWIPIGSSDAPFTGSFDGNGYTISNLSISYTDGTERAGFFGEIKTNYTIQNINITDASISTTGDGGQSFPASFVGILAGRAEGNIDNCSVSGTVSGTSYVGGLVGWYVKTDQTTASTLTLSNSSVILPKTGDTTVTGSGTKTGGLIGSTSGSVIITECFTNAAVTGNEETGGLVGKLASDANVSASYSSGNITGTGTDPDGISTGGLIGDMEDSTLVSRCYASGDVTNYTGSDYTKIAGGLVGNCKGSIKDSYTTGNVMGDDVVGGIVADLHSIIGRIENCYSIGTINATSPSYTGGITGYLHTSGQIKNSIGFNVTFDDNRTRRVSGNEKPGLINNYGNNLNVVANVDDNELNKVNGFDLTADQFKSPATYKSSGLTGLEEWKIDDETDAVWEIKTDADRPTLIGIGPDSGLI